MKIAVFYELPPGGARRSTNEIAKELKKRHEVDLYYVDDKRNLIEEKCYTKSYFYKFVPKYWSGGNWKVRLYKDTIELYKLFLLHKKVAEDIKGKKYDILFIQSSKFIESPFILRFPNTLKVFYLHDPHYRMIYEKGLITGKKVDVFRQLYEKVDRLVRKTIDHSNLQGADMFQANSKFTQKKFAQTHNKESIVCYVGVDTNFFIPKKIKKDLDIFYIGSHQPVDGYELLENAQKFAKHRLKIRMLDYEKEWITDEALRDLYQRAKMVVCTARNEPFGSVPLEAMACGTPVIAVKEGGHIETVIDGKTGLLIRRDPKVLAKKIDFLLSNSGIRVTMGKNARKHILDFWTWERSANKIEEVFSKLLKSTLHEKNK